MDQAARDALVTGYQALIPLLELPDPDDRHVLAVAIVGRCDVIVTRNLKDFPVATLTHYGVETQYPDTFLSHHLSLFPSQFCSAIRLVCTRRKNPPYSVEDYLNILTRQGLVSTASELKPFSDSI